MNKQMILNCICLAWLDYKQKYTQTIFGVLWPVIAAASFAFFLGFLFSKLLQQPIEVYMPHLAWGFAIWTFMASNVGNASAFFQSNKGVLLSGRKKLGFVIFEKIVISSFELFAQCIPAFAFSIYFGAKINENCIFILFTLPLLAVHAYWVNVVLGILCARVKDFGQLVPILLRITFFATPVIWLADSERAEQLGAFLFLNPFYHVLETTRDAALGNSPQLNSIAISIGIAIIGCFAASRLLRPFGRRALLWL